MLIWTLSTNVWFCTLKWGGSQEEECCVVYMNCTRNYMHFSKQKNMNASEIIMVKSRVRHFSCKTLQSYNSPGDCARELFKPSTDSESLVVKIETKNFGFGGVFWRRRHKEDIFWKSRPHLVGPGPQPIDPFLWFKGLVKTRWKFASIEPFIDLLAHLWPKLWAKNPVCGLIPTFSEKLYFPLSG